MNFIVWMSLDLWCCTSFLPGGILCTLNNEIRVLHSTPPTGISLPLCSELYVQGRRMELGKMEPIEGWMQLGMRFSPIERSHLSGLVHGFSLDPGLPLLWTVNSNWERMGGMPMGPEMSSLLPWSWVLMADPEGGWESCHSLSHRAWYNFFFVWVCLCGCVSYVCLCIFTCVHT